MDVQGGKNHAQAHIALFKVGNSGHDLLVSGGAAKLLQLSCQIGQLSCVTCVMANHILHQSNQLLHRRVLATTAAATAAAGAIVVMVVMIVVMVVMVMVVMMLMGMIAAAAVIMVMMFVFVHSLFSFAFF